MKVRITVIGGYCITGDDPAWKCVECETEICREQKPEQKDSRGDDAEQISIYSERDDRHWFR